MKERAEAPDDTARINVCAAPLNAHSLRELELYFKVRQCPACGRGPMRGANAALAEQPPGAPAAEIATACVSCGHLLTINYTLPEPGDEEAAESRDAINPTGEPSRILDVGQWILLWQMLADEARVESDRAKARSTLIAAAACLEEALRFYDDPDNDLPPPEAFFCDASREHFRKAPEHFSRPRLVGALARLPRDARSNSEQ